MAHKGSKKRRLSTDDDEEEHVPSKKTPASKHGNHGLNGMRSPSFSFTPHNKPAELYRKDLISAMKLADSEQLQNDDYLFIADSWKQDWEKGVQVPVNDMAILNEPRVKEMCEKSKTGDFKIPRKFLHATQDETYKQGCHELTGMNQLSELVVRYDLDDVDVCWLDSVNNEREELSLPLIHEWTMERIMENLENQCHKSMNAIIKNEEGLGIEYDEDVVCDVCRSPDSEDGNEMVFCDNCDICVHQACYGIQTIPEGSYLCRACALGVKPWCLLCPNLKGAMKSTRSGTKWAHVSCSIWIPEVSIGCVEKMEPITKISLIPASRWALVCCLCKERAGACIQCSVKTCKTAFHVTCGFNLCMDMKTILDPAEKDGVRLRAYCPKHTKNGGESSCDSPSSPKCPRSPRKDGTISPRKDLTKEEIANIRAKKLKEIEDDFSGFVDTSDAANALQADVDTVDIVAVYWKLKRRANFNRPLLMPKTEEADRLEKQQEDSLVARMKMFVHLRQDLERVRNLCYMVNRREKMKRQFLKVQEKVFLAANTYLTNPKLNLSTREVQKTVKKYKDFNVYLASNINPLPNMPPMLTQCSDLECLTTDDDRSEHSGPVFSKRLKMRRLSGLEKLDTDTHPSVSVKTEMSDNDVDIEADEPPVLEMEEIVTRKRDFSKGTLVKDGNDASKNSKSKDPMPDLLPELSSSEADTVKPRSLPPGKTYTPRKHTKKTTKHEISIAGDTENPKIKDQKSNTVSKDYKSKMSAKTCSETNHGSEVNLETYSKKLKLELKKLGDNNYTKKHRTCGQEKAEDNKEMDIETGNKNPVHVKLQLKGNKLSKLYCRKHKSPHKKESMSPLPIIESDIDDSDKLAKEGTSSTLPVTYPTIDRTQRKKVDYERGESKSHNISNVRTKELRTKKLKEESSLTKADSLVKSKVTTISSVNKKVLEKESTHSTKVSTRRQTTTSDVMHSKRSSKQQLNGMLTKPNLRIDEDIKDKVQNRILKTRGKLKRFNGSNNNMQPKINVYFVVNNSSASQELRYNSCSLNHITPVKKACEAESPGSSSNPRGTCSLSGSNLQSGRSRQNSPLQVKTDDNNSNSPDTRSFRRRIESSFQMTSSAKKDIFKPDTLSKLTASDNYSAIPMLIIPDCASLKKRLKETVNNSCAYRSHSPLSSDSSQYEQDTAVATTRRSMRSRNIDNDENSQESSSSSRSSSRLKLSNSVLKAPQFQAGH